MKKIKVRNWHLVSKWGWNYSTTPISSSGGYSIAAPASPHFRGTLKQVQQQIGRDGTYRSLKSGGTYINSRWFYDGLPILFIESEMAGSFTPTKFSQEYRWLRSGDRFGPNIDTKEEITIVVAENEREYRHLAIGIY